MKYSIHKYAPVRVCKLCLYEILVYLWYDEGKDYLSYDKPRPRKHIFKTLKRLAKQANLNLNK